MNEIFKALLVAILVMSLLSYPVNSMAVVSGANIGKVIIGDWVGSGKTTAMGIRLAASMKYVRGVLGWVGIAIMVASIAHEYIPVLQAAWFKWIGFNPNYKTSENGIEEAGTALGPTPGGTIDVSVLNYLGTSNYAYLLNASETWYACVAYAVSNGGGCQDGVFPGGSAAANAGYAFRQWLPPFGSSVGGKMWVFRQDGWVGRAGRGPGYRDLKVTKDSKEIRVSRG